MMTGSHEGVSTFLGIRLGYIYEISRLYLAKPQSQQRKLTSLEIQKLPALNIFCAALLDFGGFVHGFAFDLALSQIFPPPCICYTYLRNSMMI